MRRIVLILLVFLGGCAASQVTGGSNNSIETSVPPSQMGSVARDVQQWHDVQYPNCKFESVVSIKILKQEKNTASEQWTIKACSEKEFSYAVYVELHSGAVVDAVSNLDGHPLHVDSSKVQ